MNLMWKYVEKLQYFGKNWMLSGSKCFGGYFGLYFGGYKNEKLRTKIKYGNVVKLSNFTFKTLILFVSPNLDSHYVGT